MIVTNQFSLKANDYFKILLSLYLKRRWWFLGIVMLIGLINLSDSYSSASFFVIFAVFYPIAIVVQLWRYSHSDDNRNFLQERHFKIDSEQLVGFLSSGSESIIKISDFIKAAELKNYFLLYHSKTLFVLIPKHSFQSPGEMQWFRREIFSRILK